jgi:hypothetical protein
MCLKALKAMSVKSVIWVKGHLRLCNTMGLPAMLIKRGAEEAGSVYVKINRLDGRVLLMGPAPGPAYDERGRRRWIRLLAGGEVTEREAETYLERLRAIDPDIWIIEIEDAAGLGLLDLEGAG